MTDKNNDDKEMLPVNGRGRWLSGERLFDQGGDETAETQVDFPKGSEAELATFEKARQEAKGRLRSGGGEQNRPEPPVGVEEFGHHVDCRGNRLDPEDLLHAVAGKQKQPLRIGGSIFRNPENTPEMKNAGRSANLSYLFWFVVSIVLFLVIGVFALLISGNEIHKAPEPQGINPVKEFVVTKIPDKSVRVNFVQVLGETRLDERVFVCQPEEAKNEKR